MKKQLTIANRVHEHPHMSARLKACLLNRIHNRILRFARSKECSFRHMLRLSSVLGDMERDIYRLDERVAFARIGR